jgi:hypothetical protein
MSISAEIQLFALAVGFYVFDSMLLLFPNEGVLSQSSKNRWQVKFGSANNRIRGKEIIFPNLFLPHRPIYKLAWDYEGRNNEKYVAIDWNGQHDRFRPLMIPIYLIGFGQFVLFPYVIFFFLTDISILISLGYLYVSIIIALIIVFRRRSSLKMSNKNFFSLSFECLVCPPIAVNLVRKLSLNLPGPSEDLLVVAKRLLEENQWNVTKSSFGSRIAEAIDFEDEGSVRFEKLVAHRDDILKAQGK